MAILLARIGEAGTRSLRQREIQHQSRLPNARYAAKSLGSDQNSVRLPGGSALRQLLALRRIVVHQDPVAGWFIRPRDAAARTSWLGIGPAAAGNGDPQVATRVVSQLQRDNRG